MVLLLILFYKVLFSIWIIFILDTYEEDKLGKISKEDEKTKQSTSVITKTCTAEYTEAEEGNKHLEIKEEIKEEHALEHRTDSVEKHDTQVFMFLIYIL